MPCPQCSSACVGDLSDVLKACTKKSIKLNLSDQLTYATHLASGAAYLASKRLFS